MDWPYRISGSFPLMFPQKQYLNYTIANHISTSIFPKTIKIFLGFGCTSSGNPTHEDWLFDCKAGLVFDYLTTVLWTHNENWDGGAGVDEPIPSNWRTLNDYIWFFEGQATQCLPPWCCSITTKSLHLGKNSNIDEIGCSSVMHPPRHTTIIINNTTLGQTIFRSDKHCFPDP